MFENYYPSLKKFIDEYQLIKTLSSNLEIFTYYPQLFVIAVVSLFEKEIKEKCNNVITNPAQSLSAMPQLRNLVRSHPNDILAKIYGKLFAQEDAGIPNLSANGFYDLFGGAPFKNNVENQFSSIQSIETIAYYNITNNLYNLIGVDDKYDEAYSENDDIYNRLNNNNFTNAETAFLKLKLRRNKTAHDFLSGTSDSFEDIRNMYYDSVLYVVALKNALSNLSAI